MEESLQIGGWSVRMRMPSASGVYPLILLLHGWTGDEKSMWIFTSRFPKNALVLAPRGMSGTPLGGFGWHAHLPGKWPGVDDFEPAMQGLLDLLTPGNLPNWDGKKVSLVGFSQGAALCSVLALKRPQQVRLLAMLSGFLPEDADLLVQGAPLEGLPVFMAHGRQDNLVPVERARHAAAMLEQAGGRVFYCEEDVGHKLSAGCFRALQAFIQDHHANAT